MFFDSRFPLLINDLLIQNASYTTPYSTATLGSSADLKNHHQFSREGARSPGSLSSSAMNIHLDTSTGGANIGAGVGAGFHSHSLRGYFSDGEVSSSARRRGSAGRARKAATVVSLSEEQFLEMQEEEKYGAWHPRYCAENRGSFFIYLPSCLCCKL